MNIEEYIINEFGSNYQPHLQQVKTKAFNSQHIPSISIADYYNRIIKHTKCDKCIVDSMWIYLKRVVYNHDIIITKYNIHRLMSQAFNIAMKFWDDDHVSETFFCKVVGYTHKEFAHLELLFLIFLNFECYILK